MIENCLRLTSLEDENVVSLTKSGSPTAVSLEYRTNSNQTWQSYTVDTQVTLANGSWAEFRNTTGKLSTGSSAYYYFTMSKRTAASGNTNSLLNYRQDAPPYLQSYAFMNLFKDCATLVTAPELPSVSLGGSCYRQMFMNCSSLAQAPSLPATTTIANCYYQMFMNCSSLAQAPSLPATQLGQSCYYGMFSACSSLTQAPALPATTLIQGCYQNMFSGCTSLVEAPALPATTLANNCYLNMFLNCSALVEAPALPATALVAGCYSCMFQGCSNLKKAGAIAASTFSGTDDLRLLYAQTGITELIYSGSDFDSTQATYWLAQVPSSGIIWYTNPALDLSKFPARASNGIPNGWVFKFGVPPAKTFFIGGKRVVDLLVNGQSVGTLDINGNTIWQK